jgi:hypothetical protein
LPPINDDPLSRRDMGLEFLDVTPQMGVRLTDSDQENSGRRQEDEYRFTNDGSSVVDTHLLIVVRGLPDDVELRHASGTTTDGDPYVRVFLRNGVLLPGQSFSQELEFEKPRRSPPVSYTLELLSGQGEP